MPSRGHHQFGGTWYETGTNTKFKFTSYEREAGTGSAGDLDYAVYRSHYPRLGRFTSPDPVAGSVIDPQSLNRYAYVRNDPINLTDPLGLDPIICFNRWGYFYPCKGGHFSGGGGGGGGGGESGPWAPFGNAVYDYLYDPANGLGIISDFGSWWTGANMQASLGYKWYNLPGNWSTAAEEARHGSIITTGYDPELPNRNGMQEKFEKCQKESGDWNIVNNLTLEGYLAAEAAAADAGIGTLDVMGIWDLESSLSSSFGPIGAAGEIGPIQVTTVAAADLARKGLLPANYGKNLGANLLAGARWYAFNINVYGVPRTQGAAAYRKGHKGYKSKAGQAYQSRFNQRKKALSAFHECMKSGN